MSAFDQLPRIADRAKKVLEGVLQQALLAPLSGEFHDKFLAMYHAPGDRDAAKGLRTCVRQICENAVQEVLVAFDHQVDAIISAVKVSPPTLSSLSKGDSRFEALVEEKLFVLEEQLKGLEKDCGLDI
jgi:hypothetical protein